jgi:hypothetical protein
VERRLAVVTSGDPDDASRAPTFCPVCGDRLVVTQLTCRTCGTGLVGEFARCAFCALDDADMDLLRVFLTSRGNVREVGKHLTVSYPTARARITGLLTRLGLVDATPADAGVTRDEILAEVASGALTPDEAAALLLAA